jgi:hypothetical protein
MRNGVDDCSDEYSSLECTHYGWYKIGGRNCLVPVRCMTAVIAMPKAPLRVQLSKQCEGKGISQINFLFNVRDYVPFTICFDIFNNLLGLKSDLKRKKLHDNKLYR